VNKVNLPLVSIYIPTCNRLYLLQRAIKSVLDQTYENIEIIICDDASTDGTEDYCRLLTEQYSNVKYIRNNVCKGACASRNKAINLAEGYFISGLDDDDEFTFNRIEVLVKSFMKGDYSFVSARYYRVEDVHLVFDESPEGIINIEHLKSENIVGNQILTKTEYLRNIKGFDESFVSWQDYDTWFRLVLNYGTGYKIPDYLYIMHTEHEKGRITTSSKSKDGYKQFVTKHRDHLSKNNILSLRLSDSINRLKPIAFKDYYGYVTSSRLLIKAIKYSMSRNKALRELIKMISNK